MMWCGWTLVNIVNKELHGGSVSIEWAHIRYKQWTQHLIVSNLNAQTWDPLLCHSPAAITSRCRILTQFLEVERISVLAWPIYQGITKSFSMFRILWMRMYNRAQPPIVITATRYTCARVMLLDQPIDVPHLSDGWMILSLGLSIH